MFKLFCEWSQRSNHITITFYVYILFYAEESSLEYLQRNLSMCWRFLINNSHFSLISFTIIFIVKVFIIIIIITINVLFFKFNTNPNGTSLTSSLKRLFSPMFLFASCCKITLEAVSGDITYLKITITKGRIWEIYQSMT